MPIFIGFLLGLLATAFSGHFQNFSFENISSYGRILLITSSSIFLLGLFDDIFNLSPIFRLIFQFLVASIAWFNNLRIDLLDLTFISSNYSNIELPLILSFFITVFWIVGIINAINWMDGADGLATGLIIISSCSFLIIEYSNNVIYVSCILLSIIGSAIAFLIFNYNPAKILMGDCGSYFLGFNLSVLSFISSSDANSPLDIKTALLVMSIPLMDMIYVIANRLIKGKIPFYPDQTHIHHRLLAKGLDQKQTVKLIWSLSIFISTTAIVLNNTLSNIYIFFSLILCLLLNLNIRKILKVIFKVY